MLPRLSPSVTKSDALPPDVVRSAIGDAPDAPGKVFHNDMDESTSLEKLIELCDWRPGWRPLDRIAGESDEKYDAMNMVDYDAANLEFVDDVFRADKDVVMVAVSFDGDTLQYAAEALRADKEVVMAAVRNYGNALEYAADPLRADKDVAMAALGAKARKDPGSCWRYEVHDERAEDNAFKYVDRMLLADKQVAMAVVARDADVFTHLSDALRKDKEVVLAAMAAEFGSSPYMHIDDDLKCYDDVCCAALKRENAYWEIVMEVVSNNGRALEYADEYYRDDKEVVMAAVLDCGLALEYASETLRADKEVVMAAIQSNQPDECSLKYASETLRADKELVMVAVSHDGFALEYASETLRADKEGVIAAVSREGYAIRYASETLRADKEVVMAAVSNDGTALNLGISDTLCDDKEVVMAAMSGKGVALKYASKRLRADKEAVMAAVSQFGKGDAIMYASETLRADKEVVIAAVSNDILPINALDYAETLKNDLEVQLVMARHLSPSKALEVVQRLAQMPDWEERETEQQRAVELLSFFPIKPSSSPERQQLYDFVESMIARTYCPNQGRGAKRGRDLFVSEFDS